MEGRVLRRSRSDRMIAGVCGGLANYFGVDSVLVRLIFVLVTAVWGAGILVYIVLAIVVPEEPIVTADVAGGVPAATGTTGTATDRRASAGLILVGIGLIFLLRNLGVLWWLDWGRFWPIILIIVGAAILLQRGRR